MDKLELIPVEKLFEKDFFIPSYQRGYRWQERQVIDLLDDILEFQRKGRSREEGEFYCLQPIVITKRENDSWEVIDGQQRLTTLYLILMYFDRVLRDDYFIDKLYSINYETRPNSWIFLKKIKSNQGTNKENPDFFHIGEAYNTIVKWFENNIKAKKTTKSQFLDTLISTDITEKNGVKKDNANNIRFIWYDVETQSENDAKNIFTRINMGKIPLTNAELIKALFFINGSATDREREKHQQKLAYEWDNIESSLQNVKFWFFLNKSNDSKPTKIEFIFDLIADKYRNEIDIKINKSFDKYYTFYIFNSLINSGTKTKEKLWEEIKTYFRTFEEWYHNNTYFHSIGYLIHIGKNLEDIKKLSNDISKSGFENKLFSIIEADIENKFKKRKIEKIIELSYQDNSDLISDILLLFNVISTMDSQYSRFPFERFIAEKWSLEHIHAQNSEDLKTDKQRKLLLEEQKVFFQNNNESQILDKINSMLESDDIEFDSYVMLQEIIFKKYAVDESINIHSIDNMALLSSVDNATLNNNIFPIKRDKIIELDEKGSFIPICTKNVFLKYYSKDVKQNSQWTKKDRDAYLTSMKSKLINFLPDREKANEI